MGDTIPNSQLEKMGTELKCPICLGLVGSAVSLPCNHFFCNGCIVKSMKSGSDCPVCKLPFRRREIRAAPHMDNLASIYKTMKAASGLNVCATPDGPLRSHVPEKKKAEGNADGGQGNGNLNCQDGAEHQHSSKLRRTRKCRQSSLETSSQVSSKPAFPAKKRVQVPYRSILEAATSPQEKKNRSGENVNDGSNKNSMIKEKVATSGAEVVLSPFFWLRDEDPAEISSQDVDEDQTFDGTPPSIPTFSDIQGSDDRNSHKASPTGEVSGKYVAGGLYDSEMFEWTQRACSPELFATPSEALAGNDGIQETHCKVPLLVSSANRKPIVETKESLNKEAEMLPASTSRVIRTLQNQPHKSSKRRKSARQSVLKKCSKVKCSVNLNAPVEVEEPENSLPELLHENQVSSSGVKLTKRTTRAGFFGTSANDSTTESAGVISGFLDDQMVASESPVPSGKKRRKSKLHKRKTERVSQKINTQLQGDHSSASRKRSFESTGIEITEGVYPIGTQMTKKDNSNTHYNEVEPPLGPRCNNLRSRVKKRVSFDNSTEGMIINDCQVRCSNVSVKLTGDTEGVSILSEKITSSTEGTKEAPLAEVTRTVGFATDKCNTASSIQCAFCHSSEASEASGEMVHYNNGKIVAVDYNGGSKLLHCHKNCAEWAPNVYFKDDVAVNLDAEIARSRRIKCGFCGLKGAALGCYDNSCRKSFHVPCAKLTPQCRWDNENFVMLCPLHCTSKLPNEGTASQQTRTKKCITRQTSIQHNPLNSIQNKNTSWSWGWNPTIAAGKLVICCSALSAEERDIISQFEKLSKITVSRKWDSSVTHVVASTDENGACRRTLKVFMGILEGKWILNVEWVKACMKAMEFVKEEPYEVTADIHGIKNGPRQGRMRLVNEQSKIFQGLNFYLMGGFIPSYKGYLQDLVIAGGGTILHRKPISRIHQKNLTTCTFIIYSLELSDKHDPSKMSIILTQRQSDAEALATSVGAKAVSNTWVLNSIAACKLQNFLD